MKTRDQLNRENYQQAVKFAQYFAPELKQELEQEAEQRYIFEQKQFEQSDLQKNPQNRPLVKTAVAALLAICVIGGGYYWQTGRYSLVSQGLDAHQNFTQQVSDVHGSSKNDRYLISLQERLRENPNNGELWYELGQAYALSNDFSSALTCYGYAEKLLGKKAAIFGAMATAHYYDNGQKMNAEINALIEQALALDQKESTSLLLLASDSFLTNNYQQALDYWRRVLDGDNESINRRSIIQSMATAKQMLESQH